MNLQCRAELGLTYKAGSQIARVISEDWCSRELYYAACSSDRLSSSKSNTPAIDFVCPVCDQCFQLKSFKTWNQRKIPDAGYESMLRAIKSDRVPNLLVLQYSADWLVKNLLLVPKVFFSETVIERRPPLTQGAAGRVGRMQYSVGSNPSRWEDSRCSEWLNCCGAASSRGILSYSEASGSATCHKGLDARRSYHHTQVSKGSLLTSRAVSA